MNNYQPYTYYIAWSDHNLHYYGVRYAEGCHPDDFWKTYFTSSKHVTKARKLYGDPDIIQIRRTFADKDEAIEWEHKVLRRMKVMEHDHWLNRGIGKAPRFHPSHREALSEAAKNRRYSDEAKAIFSERSKRDWSEERLQKMLDGRTEEGRKRIAEFQRGQTRTKEHREKIREMRRKEWQDEAKTAARKRAISDAVRAKWQDPEYRARMMARRKG